MIKPTKRKTFKFYRSYFDIFNELENDKDKLTFIKALLDKQFLDIEPDLKGLVKFAYISQVHSIEKQVKGWKDATGEELTGVYDPPKGLPKADPLQEEQVKEQVEVKEQGQERFDNFWNLYDKKIGDKSKVKKKWDKLSKEDQDKIMVYIPKYINSQPDKKYRKNPETFLNNLSWNDEILGSVGAKITHDASTF